MRSIVRSATLVFCSVGLLLLLVVGFNARGHSPVKAEPLLDASDEIVYINSKGTLDSSDDTIRTFDPTQTGGAIEVTWESLESGFIDFALGDVNNDGDLEVIGIRTVISDGEIIVYDPVVVTGTIDGSTSEGIPYRTLASIPISGTPRLIAMGDFDLDVDGDEILVSSVMSGSDSRLTLFQGASQVHNGAQWVEQITKVYSNTLWEDASVGDAVLGGAEEVALLNSIHGTMRIFQPDTGFRSICSYERSDARPLDVVIGQWITGGAAEVAIVREFPQDGTVAFARFLVFSCNGSTGTLDDVDATNPSYKFQPPPHVLFTADVNNNQDDEFFMLRDLPVEQMGVHLIGRNGGPDMLDLEARLDVDNGFQAGAGGDVDGDGKDEVVILRDNKLRIYTDPEVGAPAKDMFNDFFLTSNAHDVEIGDLDKNGFSFPTQTLLDLSKMGDVAAATQSLADALNSALPSQRAVISTAFVSADKFDSNYDGSIDTKDAYVDLGDLARQLQLALPNTNALLSAEQAISTALNSTVIGKEDQNGSPWLFQTQQWHWDHFSGLAIYAPLGRDEVRRQTFYNATNLGLAGATTWDEFLASYWVDNVQAAESMPVCHRTSDGCTGLANPFPLQPLFITYLPVVRK